MSLREPLFSVIIPTYNGAPLVERCLSSLCKMRFPEDRREWIVVDNGSSDDTPMVVQKRFPRTKLVRLSRNLGFTGGIAAGVAAAEGRYLVFLNNDMRVSPQWLEAFEEVLRGDGAVCAAGTIFDRTGRYVDFVEGILLFDGHALQRFQGARAENFQGLKPCPTFIACGGNMAVRKDVYLRLGGFDHDFFAYTEDVDFSWRLHAAGYRIVSAPDAVTFHDHQATSNRLGAYRRGFLYERNAFACLYKNIDEPYFHTLTHLAWVTMIHRTRWIVSLHEPQSLGALKSPFPDEVEMLGAFEASGDSKRLLETTGRELMERVHKGLGSLRSGNFRGVVERFLEIFKGFVKRKMSPPSSSPARIVWHHPYVLSQMQALWDVSRSMEKLQLKRAGIQSLRRVPDHEIFQSFPPWIVSTYPGDKELFASPWFKSLLPQDIPFRFASLDEVHGDSAVQRDCSDVQSSGRSEENLGGPSGGSTR